jgi:predicted nucleic acid-binding protein
MNGKAFFDTNIFVYMQRSDDLQKQETAKAALDNLAGVVSTQVLNELCNIFTKKYPVSDEELSQLIQATLDTCELALVFPDTVTLALQLHATYGYSYYDCLMLASALQMKCDYILTEDMKDGQVIEETLRIVNVFAHPEYIRE